MSQDPSSSREGELLAGKYLLRGRLGEGGMGAVYRAENRMIGRVVAIKLLHSEYTARQEVVARFLQEGRTANLVRHPNVVDVLDVGQDDKGTPFIVQEFLDGTDFGKYLEAAGGRIPLDEILEIMLPVLDAVAFAHRRGVVHRDLKPENIFLSEADGVTTPKLLDFGISQIAVPVESARLTSPGTAMGTPAYMSPEQVLASRTVDASTDVWSLGVILFEAMSGQLPFEAANPSEYMVKVASEEPRSLADVAPTLGREYVHIVGRCLRRDRAARYPSAMELARDVRLAQQGNGIEGTGQRVAMRASAASFPSLEGMARSVASEHTSEASALPAAHRAVMNAPLPELDLSPDELAPLMPGPRKAGQGAPPKAPPPGEAAAMADVAIALDIRPAKNDSFALRPVRRVEPPAAHAKGVRGTTRALRVAVFAGVVAAGAGGVAFGLRMGDARSVLTALLDVYASLSFWWIRAALGALGTLVAVITLFLAVRRRPNSPGLALAGVGVLVIVAFEAISALALYGVEGGDHALAVPRWLLIGMTLFPAGCAVHWATRGYRAMFDDEARWGQGAFLGLLSALTLGGAVQVGTLYAVPQRILVEPSLKRITVATARHKLTRPSGKLVAVTSHR